METTPPRRTKRADARSSAERGFKNEKDEGYTTPLRAPRTSDSYASSRGYDAPLRIRRLRDRPDFYQEEGMDDEEMTDNLSMMLRNCTKLE